MPLSWLSYPWLTIPSEDSTLRITLKMPLVQVALSVTSKLTMGHLREFGRREVTVLWDLPFQFWGPLGINTYTIIVKTTGFRSRNVWIWVPALPSQARKSLGVHSGCMSEAAVGHPVTIVGLVDWFLKFIYLFNWKIITLQCGDGFCHTWHESTAGIHVSPPSWIPSHLPPHPIPLGYPRVLALDALLYALNLHWSSSLHMIVYMS